MVAVRCIVPLLPKLVAAALLLLQHEAEAFSPPQHSNSLSSCRHRAASCFYQRCGYPPTSIANAKAKLRHSSSRSSDDIGGNSNDDGDANANDIARRLQEKAQKLRDEIRQMESSMGSRRIQQQPPDNNDGNNNNSSNNNSNTDDQRLSSKDKSLKDKRILIIGANGRLGSMITRHILRTHGPEVKEIVAAVHYVPPDGSYSTRGYGRLSYEVGAEDGIGTIGPIWSSSDDEYNASFQYNPETMSGYNLNKLRIVEVELLDPNQVRTVCENVDAVIYCATDFEGNRPRAIASLNAAFLFRAVANPAKGRVEVEGVRNCLEGLVGDVNERRWKAQQSQPLGGGMVDESGRNKKKNPTQFVLVSTSPDAYGSFETPFGEFNGLKRHGERIVLEEFPSVSYCVLQMGKFDDNFVQEGQELLYAESEEDTAVVGGVITAKKRESDGTQKRINRRDAARAAVEALLDENLEGKKVQVYTAIRKTDIW